MSPLLAMSYCEAVGLTLLQATRRVSGKVDVVPNAVLTLRREGYRRSDFSVPAIAWSLAFPGFWRMAARHWRRGSANFTVAFPSPCSSRTCDVCCPRFMKMTWFGGSPGVRAQAVKRDGALVSEFQLALSRNMLRVLKKSLPRRQRLR